MRVPFCSRLFTPRVRFSEKTGMQADRSTHTSPAGLAAGTLYVAGCHRLPPPYLEALEGLRAPVACLEYGTSPETPGTTVFVVVTDSEGLGELTLLVETDPPHPVLAVYTGRRPALAAMCLKLGASDVICLDETSPEALAARVSAHGPEQTAWPMQVLDTLSIGVAVRGDGGRFRYRNPAYQRIPPEILGDSGPGALAPLDLEQVTDPASGRIYLRSRSRLNQDGPDRVLEVVEDITGRHLDQGELARHRDALVHHTRELSRANRELSKLDRAKSEFIALAAHELRTPLTAIRNAVFLLTRHLTEASEETSRFLGLADRNIRRLGSLAEDLLNFTKLETRQLALAFEPLNLAACARETVRGLESDLEVGRLTALLDLPEELPVIQGDPSRLAQLVTHLLEHAVKRSPEGGEIRIRGRALATWEPIHAEGAPHAAPDLPAEPDGWVELCVEDRGKQVPSGKAAELFESFAPSLSDPAGEMDEIGLGLAICRKIAAAHGGVVWAVPADGEGVCLTLRLPRLSESGARLLSLSACLARLRRERAKPRLLVMEPGDGVAMAAAKGALVELCRPGWQFVDLKEPAQIVAAIGDGERAVSTTLERVMERVLSSKSHNRPIKVGWITPKPSETFREALGRARASVHPHEPDSDTNPSRENKHGLQGADRG